MIVVASVSCIYGLGVPDTYADSSLHLALGDTISASELVARLRSMQYDEAAAYATAAGREMPRGSFTLREARSWRPEASESSEASEAEEAPEA